VTNKNEDLAIDFNFTKTASFKATPCKGKLLPGQEHFITLSFEPKNLGVITQEMFLDLLGGQYRNKLRLSGHCNAVGTRKVGVRGPMARPQDFEPERNFITEDEAEARTLQMKKKGGPSFEKTQANFDKSYSVQSALKAGNAVAVEKYASILENKYKANDFITQERTNRTRDIRINAMHKANGRLPPETLEEMDKDPDLGMASYN
jgi:hypothetical protein